MRLAIERRRHPPAKRRVGQRPPQRLTAIQMIPSATRPSLAALVAALVAERRQALVVDDGANYTHRHADNDGAPLEGAGGGRGLAEDHECGAVERGHHHRSTQAFAAKAFAEQRVEEEVGAEREELPGETEIKRSVLPADPYGDPHEAAEDDEEVDRLHVP